MVVYDELDKTIHVGDVVTWDWVRDVLFEKMTELDMEWTEPGKDEITELMMLIADKMEEKDGMSEMRGDWSVDLTIEDCVDDWIEWKMAREQRQ